MNDDPAVGAFTVVSRCARAAAAMAARNWPVAALVVLWWLVVRVNGYNQVVLPYPEQVFSDVVTNPLTYLAPTVTTLLLAITGLVLGMALGTGASVLLNTSRLVSGMITPAAMLMRSVPVVAMIPVIARLLGYSTQTVLATTVIISFFPAFVFSTARFRTPPPATADVFTVLNASAFTRLRRLLLPHAIPGLLVALRMTAPTTVLAAMLSEYLLGSGGLGELFAQSVAYGRNTQAWGAAVMATVASATLFTASRAVERWSTARAT